jgi:hypothetical protein
MLSYTDISPAYLLVTLPVIILTKDGPESNRPKSSSGIVTPLIYWGKYFLNKSMGKLSK